MAETSKKYDKKKVPSEMVALQTSITLVCS